jgi:hypothetical protein
MLKSFHVKLRLCDSVILDILEYPTPFFHFVIISTFNIEQNWIPFIETWFVPRSIDIGRLGLKTRFPNLNMCKTGFPYCGPTWPLWIMIFKKAFMYSVYLNFSAWPVLEKDF